MPDARVTWLAPALARLGKARAAAAGTRCADGDARAGAAFRSALCAFVVSLTAACEDGLIGDNAPFAAVIAQAAQRPVLDGELDPEFATVVAAPMTHLLRGLQPEPQDLGARWRALYDSSSLYLIFEVEDDVPISDSATTELWEDDSLEVFVDGDLSAGKSYDGRDDVHLVFRPHDPVVRSGTITADFNATAIGVETTPSPNGYVFEVFIPWWAIGTDGRPGKVFGLDVHINDDDDGMGRDHKLSWWTTDDDAWTRPDLFGTVRLATAREDM